MPDEWEITREWTADQARARAAQAVLLHLERSVFTHLPRDSSEWLDLLEQQIHRSREFAEFPSAYTDWAATLSEYGRYPSTLYIERRPRGTFDTPLTRTLKWLCTTVTLVEQLVFRTLRQQPLGEATRDRFLCALELPEVQRAADVVELDEFDASICMDVGGSWTLIATAARQLASLWRGSMQTQFLALAPILPRLGSQLFELGSLGAALVTVQEIAPSASWRTRTPLAAASPGMPCVGTELSGGRCDFYFQTVPTSYRRPDSPYRVLSRALGGRPLRPDLWMMFSLSPIPTEVLVECKYSYNRGYIAEGVQQVLAYWEEFPPVGDVQRIHVVVAPETVVEAPASWGGRLALGTPSDLRSLIQGVCRGAASEVLASWS